MDIKRHSDIFEPSNITGTVAVIGCGALGTAVALQLAKLGVRDIILFDADVIEPHNLPNQMLYGPGDVGDNKAMVLRRELTRLTDNKCIDSVDEMLENRGDLTGVEHLFVCVDSMRARRAIYETCVHLNPRITYYAEGRVGSRSGHVSAFHPDVARGKAYLGEMYTDAETTPDVGSCGGSLMIGATATLVATQMVWHWMMAYPAKGAGTTPWEHIDFKADDLQLFYKGMQPVG